MLRKSSWFGLAACAILLGFSAVGCVTVRPLDRAIETVPAEDWVEVNGTRVHAVQRGEGPAVILLHGFGGSTYSWRKVIPGLSAEHHVIAVDLLGFGWTERPENLEAYSRQGQIDLVIGLMDVLEIDQVDLIGHSYGGAMAMAIAAEHPHRVRSLVLVNSAPPSYPVTRRKWFAAVPPFAYGYVRVLGLRDTFIRSVLKRSYYRDEALTAEDIVEYRDRLRVEGAVRAYRGLTSPYRRQPDSLEVQLEVLEQPSLVLWGVYDKLIPLETGRAAASRLPRCRFVEIGDAGHAPMEEQPKAFVSEVLRFLRDPEAAIDGSIDPASRGASLLFD